MPIPSTSYNRRRKQKEILASITFESRACAAPSRLPNTISPTLTTEHSCVKDHDHIADNKHCTHNTNEATALVILCMKEALEKSIQSISLKSKERSLNAHVDFSYKTKVYFKERKAGCERRTLKRHTVFDDDGVTCCGITNTKDIRGVSDHRPMGGRLSIIDSGRIVNEFMIRDYDASGDEDDSGSCSTDNDAEMADRNTTKLNINSNMNNNKDDKNNVKQKDLGSSEPFGDECDDPLINDRTKNNGVSFKDEEKREPIFPVSSPLHPSLTNVIHRTTEEESCAHPQIDYNQRCQTQRGSGGAEHGFPNSNGNCPKREEARVAFTFTDYSPMCYRHIRQFFGVKPRVYKDVLVNSGWHSVPTPGKSAAQLFFCGQNWVIKTMTKAESKFLRSILHRYYNHVRDHPNTLLPHFVGHHSLRLENGKKMTFVIMQNVFATTNKIREKFDLKGSTVGRVMTQEEAKIQTSTKKDLNINRPINIGHERREKLILQLQVDSEFLKQCEIMDYSLLLGIHPIVKGVIDRNDNNMSISATEGDCVTLPPSPTLHKHTSSHQWNGSSVLATSDIHKRKKTITYPLPPPSNEETYFTTYQGGILSENLNPQPALPNMHNDMKTLSPSVHYNNHNHYNPNSHVAECREIYYVGIIDILQQYNTWKRSETFVMGIRHGSMSQISSVSPNEYADRFVSFMSSLIV